MTTKLSPKNFQETDKQLFDLLEEVQRWEGTLAGETKLGSGAAAVTNLRDSKVSLGNPKLTLLTEATFQETGTELSSIYRQQMQDQYDFYYLTLKVELRPKSTVQFWKLICELDFGPKGEQEPILQSVFPNEKWRSVLSTGVGMDIGLNGNLDWTAGVDISAISAVLEQVPGEIQGKVANKNEFNGFVTMPAYKYEFGLFEILTTGVSSTAYWRIQDEALKKTRMVEFATVFKVPKAVQEIELVGKVWVEPNVNWLFADVRDVASELSDRFKQLFRNKEEAANQFKRWDAEKWQLQLPKSGLRDEIVAPLPALETGEEQQSLEASTLPLNLVHTIPNGASPFASFDELRDAHRDLLKQYRDKEVTPAVAEKIEQFIYRGQATGALLEDEEERWDAQSRLDYWIAMLQRVGHELPNAILFKFNPTVKLDNVIQRIAAGEATEEDLQLLRNVMTQSAEQSLISLGKYNVNIAQGQDIQIGDRINLGKYNVNIAQGQDIQIGDRIYQGAGAETIRQVLSELLEARQLRALLTYAEFSDRVEQSALTSYQVPLIGRDQLLQQIRQDLSSDSQVIVLHGPAGLGKTRLLLALTDISDAQKQLWYVRNEAESIESELASLDSGEQHIIVVDDAHRFKLLYELREVLINPKFAGKVTLILATRSNFKESVLYQLDVRTSPVSTIEIEPLQNADIDQILEGPPYQLSNQELRYTIVKIAEGNPLIAGIAARLSKQGVALSELTRDQLLTRYLDDIIRDLSGGNTESDFYVCCVRYLQVLAALGTISLKNEELQSKIYQVMPASGRGSTFTSLDEARLVSRLVEAGIVEQYGQTLKISSEVLADYILTQHFFNPKTKQADYQKLIIEPFFQVKPREVLTSLAEAEFKGESSEASSLLAHNLNELRRAIRREGNVFRLNLLRSLREVAYLRPDDILAIVATIVDAPELPPETVQVELFGPYPIGHDWVLSEAVEVLERTIYRGDIRNTIDYLYKLANYKNGEADYEKVRAKAKKALTEIAEFKLRKPYAVQQILLDKISDWLEQNFEEDLALSLVLIQPMLKVDFHGSETDPTKPFTINIHRGSLDIASDLRRIRDRALEILCNAYQQVQDLQTRMQIVQILCGATYTSNPKDRTSSQTHQQLQADCARIAHFFSETVLPTVELPIFDRIAEWLRQAQHFNKYQAVELDRLKQQLKEHRGYQLYRLLVGGYRWDEEGNRLNWQTIEQQKRQKIQEYVAEISPLTLDQAIQELEAIAKQARDAGKNDTFGLNDLLVILGQTQPTLAQQFIERVLVYEVTLKQHVGYVLAGLRLADQKAARAYVQSWLGQEDSVDRKFSKKGVGSG